MKREASLAPEPRGAAAPLPRVVVGYDGGQSARAAVDWAVSTLPVGSTLVLVYAARSLHAPTAPYGAREERHLAARACFDELALEADDAFLACPLETEFADTDPVSALLDASVRHDADAIVVGLDRHSRLSSALGTVATELLRRSAIPVTAVPA